MYRFLHVRLHSGIRAGDTYRGDNLSHEVPYRGGYRDDDIENIVAVMQRARDSAQFGEAISVEEGLKEVDGVLHKNEEDSF